MCVYIFGGHYSDSYTYMCFVICKYIAIKKHSEPIIVKELMYIHQRPIEWNTFFYIFLCSALHYCSCSDLLTNIWLWDRLGCIGIGGYNRQLT